MLEREAYAVDAGTNPYQKSMAISGLSISNYGDFNEKAAAARQRLLSKGQDLQSRLMTAQAMRAPALPVGWVV